MLKYEQFVCMCTYETLIKCLRELSTLQYTGRSESKVWTVHVCMMLLTG